MARHLFWAPYNKARIDRDFRDLIKAIERGDPLIMEPEVRELIADQLKDPRPPSRKTSLRDSFIWARRIEDAMRQDTGRGKVTRAMNKVLDDYPDKSMDALKDHWKEYRNAKRIHDSIE